MTARTWRPRRAAPLRVAKAQDERAAGTGPAGGDHSLAVVPLPGQMGRGPWLRGKAPTAIDAKGGRGEGEDGLVSFSTKVGSGRRGRWTRNAECVACRRRLAQAWTVRPTA